MESCLHLQSMIGLLQKTLGDTVEPWVRSLYTLILHIGCGETWRELVLLETEPSAFLLKSQRQPPESLKIQQS